MQCRLDFSHLVNLLVVCSNFLVLSAQTKLSGRLFAILQENFCLKRTTRTLYSPVPINRWRFKIRKSKILLDWKRLKNWVYDKCKFKRIFIELRLYLSRGIKRNLLFFITSSYLSLLLVKCRVRSCFLTEDNFVLAILCNWSDCAAYEMSQIRVLLFIAAVICINCIRYVELETHLF